MSNCSSATTPAVGCLAITHWRSRRPFPTSPTTLRQEIADLLFFIDNTQPEHIDVGYVHFAGILWGGPESNPQITWFSPMDNVEYDLGLSFLVCGPYNSC